VAITGTLLADFTPFYDAAKKAEASLVELGKTGNAVGRMLDATVEGFDTAPAVAEVKQMDEALKGVSTTATSKAKPALADVGGAAGGASDEAMTFSESFKQVDKSLAAAGIQLGPLPGMLDELASAAGKSVGQLGLLATAGATVAAAVGGWSIGRWIAGLGDLDTKIGGATAKLLGWGDVAAQEAAAGAETLARASAVAGQQITNMDQAVRVLTEGAKANAAEQKKLAEELEKGKAEAARFAEFTAKLFSRDDITRAQEYVVALGGVGNVTKLTADKKKELNKVVTDAIAAYNALGERAPAALEAIQRATTELIPVTQSFSATNSKMWVAFAAGVDDGKAKMAEIAESSKLHWSDIGGASRETLEQIAATTKEKYELAMRHSDHFTGKQIADFRRAAAEAQAAVEAWGTDTIEAYDAIAAASTEATEIQIENSQRSAAAAQLSWSEAMDAVRAGQGTMTGTLPPVKWSKERKAETLKAWQEGRYYGPVKMGMWGMEPDWEAIGAGALQAGGPARAGRAYVVGEKGPELFVPKTSGTVVPSGAGGPMNVTINVNGSVLGNKQEIARVVGEALMASLRGAGMRLPVGA
jgi:hypothetical protein